eukprot:4601669-Amphidinium_carterae.1
MLGQVALPQSKHQADQNGRSWSRAVHCLRGASLHVIRAIRPRQDSPAMTTAMNLTRNGRIVAQSASHCAAYNAFFICVQPGHRLQRLLSCPSRRKRRKRRLCEQHAA